ncbi:hybrid sensor histidine kinase/response regulator [Ktedonospora formicarum]|uniref:histidine kinase n=1 Tax=Ktedonospora formicarum TaxID=2778364 RepID=A0A8J3HWY9_9CHLR|nr:hybrid sensor histidine kinase/response regulator [Ktedonospora formicarum]GHO45299.1 hybrid sensor histidine kinase/response regulator [Ktedonospora formicarum]
MTGKEPIICIIEDNPADRAVFRRYLLQDVDYSYQFYEEETGEGGVELCRKIHPDCVLLDYNLPDMDGLEFLDELIESENTIPYPVIMLTGLGNEAVAVRAMKMGAQDYLVKDEMTPGNLFRAIHSAIERNSLMRTLERQREDLERKNQEIQAFAFALAHDLRTPLRAISGFAQIIEHDYSDKLDASGLRYIHHVVHASAQMDHLIDDLLNYTRIEHRSVHTKPIALDYLFQQVLERLQERVSETGASIILAPDLPYVQGDPTLANQVFVNLLDNALTYHQPEVKPRVEISTRVDGAWITILMKDNGIGIALKHWEKIFNLFQRLHGDDEYAGTGIGLAIVRKAVELMSGQVWVESEVGQGSTFHVKLPLSPSS